MSIEPIGHEWLADLRERFAEEFPEPASSTPTINHAQDGTVIVTDAAGNSASGRTTEEALANFGRKA